MRNCGSERLSNLSQRYLNGEEVGTVSAHGQADRRAHGGCYDQQHPVLLVLGGMLLRVPLGTSSLNRLIRTGALAVFTVHCKLHPWQALISRALTLRPGWHAEISGLAGE